MIYKLKSQQIRHKLKYLLKTNVVCCHYDHHISDFMWKTLCRNVNLCLFSLIFFSFSFFLINKLIWWKITMREGLLIILLIYTYILTYKHTIYITPSSKDSYPEEKQTVESFRGQSRFTRIRWEITKTC